MTIEGIVQELDAEIARLQQVRKLLSNGSRLSPVGLAAVSQATSPNKAGRKKKRTLSPEARQRIAEAQRKRWATAKKVAK